MLDGEIYKHGWPLQKISGLARTKEITPEKYQDIIHYLIFLIISLKSNVRLSFS